MTIRVANGAGFLGDNLESPRRLVENAAVDYLTLEYLAELTMSILARQREKDPNAGFAADFLDVLKSLIPALKSQPNLKIITNAGGMNPQTCAANAARILSDANLSDTVMGVVASDDLLPRLPELKAAGCQFENLDTGKPLSDLRQPIVSANAYLGAKPIVDALTQGARVVITGRVADASLTVAPIVKEFGWKWDDWNRLAGASVAGHLIECGAQVTGGLYRHWQNLNLADVGYPIAEISDDGSSVITKPNKTGGVVNRATVIEQLVYEIGDPTHYLTPDVDVDFMTVDVNDAGLDRVAVKGATGRPAPNSYKVSLAYQSGFTAAGQLLVYGNDALEKAKACGEMILRRVARDGFKLEQTLIECLGIGDSVPHSAASQTSGATNEIVLRVSATASNREALERFAKEFTPLITSGPPGLAGYATGRPQVRPVFAYWPTLVPKDVVPPSVVVKPASKWIAT